jgi:uncharacterized SAM-binding protein YcdF (DUF218 family)
MSFDAVKSAGGATPVPGKTRRRWPWLTLVCVAAMTLIVFAGRSLGRWLVVQDPLESADAIVVLSGGMPERAIEAARIYRQGFAPQVWLTHSTEPGASLREHGVNYTGEDTYDKLLLMHEGVPESAIHVLDPPIVNTADEINVAGRALRKVAGRRKIIVVTSQVHTRRARTLWRRLASGDGTAIVRGVTDDSFDSAHWWRSTTDAFSVVREVLGLLNAWAGLPLQPAT